MDINRPAPRSLWASVRRVAGWELDFDVATEDVDLARDCFRVLRRTCARFYVEFSYFEAYRTIHRVVFVFVFDGRPHQLGLASADLALEMRAVSMLQKHRRRRNLPLRLLHWVTYSGSEEPLRLQPPSDRVPADKRDVVVRHLEEYALAWGTWARGELSPPVYLEAQHSLLSNLALDLAEGVTVETKYPELIRALRVPERWEQDCLDLGRARNRVKHRGFRHEAARYAQMYTQMVYSVAYDVTGIDTMPRSAYMLRWELDAKRAIAQPPMFDRGGEPKRFTRY